MKNKGFTAVLVFIVAIVAVVGWYFSTRNKLVTLEEDTSSAWAEIDNQLQRRCDLIPNLVNTVKGYAKHESEVFGNIAEARSKLAGAQTVEEKSEGYNELQGALSRLLMVVENYPELKSNANFQQLQDELAGTENRIAVARKRYNDKVRSFNTQIKVFPSSFVAERMGLEKKSYFEIAESARAVPKVEF
ncbi:MAG: LemA family protein [Spirochaetia bacterium]|nr:LemA family protein [Spirochaetia bacterium]